MPGRKGPALNPRMTGSRGKIMEDQGAYHRGCGTHEDRVMAFWESILFPFLLSTSLARDTSGKDFSFTSDMLDLHLRRRQSTVGVLIPGITCHGIMITGQLHIRQLVLFGPLASVSSI